MQIYKGNLFFGSLKFLNCPYCKTFSKPPILLPRIVNEKNYHPTLRFHFIKFKRTLQWFFVISGKIVEKLQFHHAKRFLFVHFLRFVIGFVEFLQISDFFRPLRKDFINRGKLDPLRHHKHRQVIKKIADLIFHILFRLLILGGDDDFTCFFGAFFEDFIETFFK